MYLPTAHIFHFNPHSYRAGGDLFQITSPETLGEIIAIMKGEMRRKSLRQKSLAWSSRTDPYFYEFSGQLNIHPICNPSLYYHFLWAWARLLQLRSPRLFETYSWVHFLKSYNRVNEDSQGISLQWKGVRTPDDQHSLRGAAWKRVTDPCFNCQESIRMHAGIIANFYGCSGLVWGYPGDILGCYGLLPVYRKVVEPNPSLFLVHSTMRT